MSRLVARVIAHVIMASRWVDRAHSWFDKARSRVAVRFASERVLSEFNALAYERDKTYVPGTESFRHHLFAWESEALREHFPAPPARLLVGGAGGGREAFSLAERGYDVVAFEPAAELAAGMADTAPSGRVQAFRARYETLPLLAPARTGQPGGDLRDLGPFDGVLMGWGSFSHLTTEERRVEALRSMAAVVDGPILVSFLAFHPDDQSPLRRRGDRSQDRFSAFIGYYHVSTPAELRRLTRAAGLEIVALESDASESAWPYAVLKPSPQRRGSTARVVDGRSMQPGVGRPGLRLSPR